MLNAHLNEMGIKMNELKKMKTVVGKKRFVIGNNSINSIFPRAGQHF